MKSRSRQQTEQIPHTDPSPTPVGDGGVRRAATVATHEAPDRLAQVAQDRDRLHELDRRAVLRLLAEAHGLEAMLVDRLLVLDAQDAAGDDQLLTVEEAARLLRLQPDWLRRRPDLPFVVHISGGAVRVSKRKLLAWIARRTGSKTP